jgi:hypothetical protein
LWEQQLSEQSWMPLFRTSKSTVTKVMKSPAFAASREQAAITIADPAALRALAVAVLELDFEDAPLSAIADRVVAAVRFLKAKANRLETGPAAPLGAGDAARERLLVAALQYLITPIDVVPDFGSAVHRRCDAAELDLRRHTCRTGALPPSGPGGVTHARRRGGHGRNQTRHLGRRETAELRRRHRCATA